MIASRQNITIITQGANYLWAILISFGICLLGSVSIGFPIPFPFVLFTLSNSIYLKFSTDLGLALNQILMQPTFWFQITGLAIAGGLGSALGELSGYLVGFGAKKIVEKAESSKSGISQNINGFGKLVLNNPKRTPFYIFIFALTPLPDDILFLPLGMIRYPPWKSIIPGWLGKNFTTFLYCIWPILAQMGFLAAGIETNLTSDLVTEAILLLLTITAMLFIFSFNWNKLLEERRKKEKEPKG
jgi:membrane protein YqaA with SNARE-associated domain